MERYLDYIKSKFSDLVSYTDSRSILFSAVLIIAFLLRINGLGEHSLWVDEAGTASLVETFLREGIPQYPSGESSYRSLPFLLLTSIFTALFGLKDFALRLPSALAGTLTVILVFIWSKQGFNFKTGLTASTFIAILPWHIALSQNARMYSLFQLVYLATFYSIYRYEKTGKDLYLFLTASLAVISMLTHVTGYILLASLPLYLLLSSDKSLKNKILPVGLITTATILTSQLLYFDIIDVLERFNLSPNSAFEHLSWMSLNNTFIFFSGLIGLAVLSDKKRKLFTLYSLAIIPPSIIYLYFVKLPASRYLFFTIPFLAITSSYLIFYLIDLKSVKDLKVRKYLPLLALIAVVASGNPIDPELGSHSPQPDFKSIYNHIDEHTTENDTIIVGRPLPADYYLKRPDYVLIEQGLKDSLTVDGKEFYSNSPLIENKTGLDKVMDKRKSGWIVASENVERGIEPGLRETIKDLELVKKERKITLWRWR